MSIITYTGDIDVVVEQLFQRMRSVEKGVHNNGQPMGRYEFSGRSVTITVSAATIYVLADWNASKHSLILKILQLVDRRLGATDDNLVTLSDCRNFCTTITTSPSAPPGVNRDSPSYIHRCYDIDRWKRSPTGRRIPGFQWSICLEKLRYFGAEVRWRAMRPFATIVDIRGAERIARFPATQYDLFALMVPNSVRLKYQVVNDKCVLAPGAALPPNMLQETCDMILSSLFDDSSDNTIIYGEEDKYYSIVAAPPGGGTVIRITGLNNLTHVLPELIQ